jgi:hypothetical protein
MKHAHHRDSKKKRQQQTSEFFHGETSLYFFIPVLAGRKFNRKSPS